MKNLAEKQHTPPPPDWLDTLISQPFNQFASLQVDRWLDYIKSEFEGVK